MAITAIVPKRRRAGARSWPAKCVVPTEEKAVKTHSLASRIAALALLLNAGAVCGNIDLEVELPAARAKLEAILPADMHVTRAEVLELREGGAGILFHAFPTNTSLAHPSFALFLWPNTNRRDIAYETGWGTHTFRRIGSSGKFLVYYSGPSGFMKDGVRQAFCPFDYPFQIRREGTNAVVHWRFAADEGYQVFLQAAPSPMGPWQTLTNASQPHIVPSTLAEKAFFRKVRFL